ncbi:sulfurtransferase TusA family protein [Thermocladium modestius]|nr:sulfurtransferase TusA family protein [Thermocladium modestius]
MVDELILDVRGKMCPMPVMEVSKAARQATPGQVIRVLATDPAAKSDISAWAQRTGNEIVDIRDEEGYVVIIAKIVNPGK